MKLLYSIIGIVTIFWLISLALLPNVAWDIWFWRNQLILLTGVIAFVLMAFIMLLSVRPKWLEKYLDGLDKMYLLHKWAGILAIITGALHYLIELAGPLLAEFFARGEKGPKVTTFLSPFRGISKEMGEWVIWFLLAVLVITLWHKFSYTIWRYVHKLIPVAFIILAFHSIVLSPLSYWTQPIGWLVMISSIVGIWCAIIALFGQIGKRRQYKATITHVEKLTPEIINVSCQIHGNWQHNAGQYAFLCSKRYEGAHPFTLSSNDTNNNIVRFSIKALGDYTVYLQDNIHIGDIVTVEGPYGCFDFRKKLDTNQRQIWIGGGIGITPFIAWLESLKTQPLKADQCVQLYYCINRPQENAFADILAQLVSAVENVTLHTHYDDQCGYFDVTRLDVGKDAEGKYPDIWFCGPTQFSQHIKRGLKDIAIPLTYFHQESFQMR